MAVHGHPLLPGIGEEIFEKLPTPTLVVDADVAVLGANAAARRALGLDGEGASVLLRRGGDLLHCVHAYGPGGCGRQPACQDCVIRAAVGEAFEHGRVERRHATLGLRSEAGVVDASFLVSAAPIENDGETQVVLTLEDVTGLDQLEREVGQARRALGRTEDRLRQVFRSMSEAFALHEVVLDDSGVPRDYRFLEVNPAFERMTGLERSSVLGRRVTAVLPGVDPAWIETYGRVAVTGAHVRFERFEPVLGRHYEVMAFRSAPLEFATLFLDVTERKESEDALARFRNTLATLHLCSEVILRATSQEELYTGVCRVLVEAGGYRMAWVGLRQDDDRRTVLPVARAGDDDGYLDQAAVVWADVPEGRGPTGTAIREGRPVVGRSFASDPRLSPWKVEAQRRGYASCSALPISVEGDAVACLTMYAGDLSRFSDDELSLLKQLADDMGFAVGAMRRRDEARRGEQALREREAHFRQLVESLPLPVAFNDARGAITTINARFTEVLGYTLADIPTVDAWFEKAYPDEDYRRHVRTTWGESHRAAAATGNGIPTAEFQVTCANGEVRTIAISGNPIGQDLVVVLEDVTENRSLQGRLAVASRLAALGTLVSGLAHEINSPLAAELADQGVAREIVDEIRSRLRTGARLDREGEARLLDDVAEAIGNAQEAGERIARIVKDMSTFGRPDAARTPTGLAGLAEKALRWLPSSVSEAATIRIEDRGAPRVVVAVGQLQQVIVNLVTNAARATRPGERGTIVIRLGPGAQGRARLEVVDRGTGVPPEIRDRIFDPFFTTRPSGEGRGTGLGLAICHAIVSAHGGTLTFESEVGRGSTFQVELPAAPPVA